MSTEDEASPQLNRRERQKEETRKKVYEAALEVFREQGIAACRIDDIASRAGVSRGTFYFHFPTKEDVLVELMRVSGEVAGGQVADLPDDASLDDVFKALSDALCELWSNDPRLLPDLATVALKQTANQLGDQDANLLRASLADRFRAAADRGEIASFLVPQMLSDLYLANVLAAMLAWCAYPEIPLSQVLEGVTAIFLGGAASNSMDLDS